MARRLTLPDPEALPALAEVSGRLNRLEALVDQRTMAEREAAAALVAAQAADAAERVAAIREQREPADATEPAAEMIAAVAARDLTDSQAALDAELAAAHAAVQAGAPEWRDAMERDLERAKAQLRKRVASCREALATLERVPALCWWLEGAREGQVRPFTGGRPLQSATAGPHGGPLTGAQLLDALGEVTDPPDRRRRVPGGLPIEVVKSAPGPPAQAGPAVAEHLREVQPRGARR